MRRFFTSRLFRACVCLILVCCVLVLNSPIHVHASAGGLVAAKIVEASTVSCNPYVIGAACLIALGVWAAAETGAFENLNRNVTNWLMTQNFTNSRGEFDILQTVNELGEKTFYVAGDMLESVRGWLFESGTISVSSFPFEGSDSVAACFAGRYAYSLSFPYHFLAYQGNFGRWICGYSSSAPFTFSVDSPVTGSMTVRLTSGGSFHYFKSDVSTYTESSPGSSTSGVGSITFYDSSVYSPDLSVSTAYDLSLGNVPLFYIDGTSALEWAPEYANRQLRVINTGGGNNPDGDGDPNWKWYMPLALGSMAALLTQVQSDQWSGVTPEEFSEYDTIQDFEILDKPEIDDFVYIEIQPITQPEVNPDPYPDPGSNPDEDPTTAPGTGTDPGTDPGTNPGTGTDPGTDPGTNPGTGTDPGSGTDPGGNSGSGDGTGSSTPPESMHPFMLDLKDFFPFCIPFDLYKFFSLLCAEPEAPVFTWVVQDLGGNSYPITVDLSKWDNFAALFRKLQLFVFIIGLAMSSRKFIKW